MLNTGEKISVWGIVIGAAVAILIAAITVVATVYPNEAKMLACDHFAIGCELKVDMQWSVYDGWASSTPGTLRNLFPDAPFKCGDTELPMPVTGGKWFSGPRLEVAPDRSTPPPNTGLFADPYLDPPRLTRYLVWRLELALPPNAIDEPLSVTAIYHLPRGSTPDFEESTITVDPAGQTQCEVIPFYREVTMPGRYSLEVKVYSPRLSMGRNHSEVDVQP